MSVIAPTNTMPNAEALRSYLGHIQLFEYMMTCNRTEIGCCLPIPPPPRLPNERHEDLLGSLNDRYMCMIYMLNDSVATEREIQMFEGFTPLNYLSNYLPRIKRTDIIKIPYPTQKMDHLDYVFLIRKCWGHESDLKDFIFFTKETDRDLFLKHMSDKYAEQRNTVNSNCKER